MKDRRRMRMGTGMAAAVALSVVVTAGAVARVSRQPESSSNTTQPAARAVATTTGPTALGSSGSSASAASFWEMTGVDGSRRPAPAGVALGDGVLRLTRQTLPARSAEFVLILRDGRRLPGEPTERSTGESIGWRHRLLGELSFPLGVVAGVERVRPAAAGLGKTGVGVTGAPVGQDLAFLANGDKVIGLVTGVSRETVTFQPASGDAVAVSWKAIDVLTMTDVAGGPAGAAATTKESGGHYRVELSDGTILSAAELTLNGAAGAAGTIVIRASAGAAETVIPLTAVALVERLGFDAASLSLLVPTERIHRPYLTVSRLPIADAVVDGGPMATRRGLTLTAYTKITYAVPPGMRALRMAYGLDPSASSGGGVGTASVRVLAGDKVLHEGTALAKPSSVAEWAFEGAPTVSIEVGFGTSGGSLARVNVLEPLFVR